MTAQTPLVASRSAARDRDRARASIRSRHRVVRLGPWSARVERRTAFVHLILSLIALAAGVVGILIGDYGISPGQVLASFVGRAEDPMAQYFVTELRAPRAATALLVGAALGTSGAIFQTLSGNPLGSPDIIGFTTGAATGALLTIIVLEGDSTATALGAVLGGLAAAGVVYGLAWRGGVAGFRLVLVGIGIGAVLSAVNTLLVVKAPLDSAQTATHWLAGSLNAALWPEAISVAIALVLLLPIAWSQHRVLTMLPLGDPSATGLGIRTERSRFVLVIVGVALVSVATASTGPIAFVALAAPHLARKLTRTTGAGLGGAALMGAVLVLVSDLIARRIFAPTELEVGVITGSLGGLYLVWLLAVERKRL